MTIEELYLQTNLIEYVEAYALPEYMQSAHEYEKKYKISVFNMYFNAVTLGKLNNTILFYLLDYSNIPERFIVKMINYKDTEYTKHIEGYIEMSRRARYHTVKDLTPQSAQNIINSNIVFFRQFKERAERQQLINLVNNL
jgi:hypothetical protein